MWTVGSVFSAALSSFWCVANLVVLAAVLRKRLQKSGGFERISVVDFFILQIVVSDCFAGALILASLVLSGGNLNSTGAPCKVSSFGIDCFAIVSLLHLFALAYSRYSVMRDVFKTGMSFHKARMISAALWTVGIVIGSTGISDAEDLLPAPSELYCRRADSTYGAIITLVVIFVPSVGIFGLYYKIVQATRRDTINNKVPRQVMTLILVLNVVYIVCFFPFGVTGIYQLISGSFVPAVYDSVTIILAVLNYCTNPILYCIYQRKYRSAVLEITGMRYILRHFEFGQSTSSQASASRNSKSSTGRRGSSSGANPLSISTMNSVSAVAGPPRLSSLLSLTLATPTRSIELVQQQQHHQQQQPQQQHSQQQQPQQHHESNDATSSRSSPESPQLRSISFNPAQA